MTRIKWITFLGAWALVLFALARARHPVAKVPHQIHLQTDTEVPQVSKMLAAMFHDDGSLQMGMRSFRNFFFAP
ncbi:hypothetical protein BJ741DRAFT_625294 [Chytriomyces cf. hyalinus JEL632]|nr:hypothetical protein BJ741DRAFT_625294 [Chytriomyces cf. hyalinus JEL632]